MQAYRTEEELKGEEDSFLNAAHKTKAHRKAAASVWTEFQKISRKDRQDKWAELREHKGDTEDGSKIFGRDIMRALRYHLAEIQGTRCCYCRRWLQNIAYARPLEHILPRALFPQFSIDYRNLAVSCFDCNHLKGAKSWTNLDEMANEYLTHENAEEHFHPRIHRYEKHIKYIIIETNDSSIAIYEGITVQGKQLCKDHLLEISQVGTLANNNPAIAKSIEQMRIARQDANANGFTKLEEFQREVFNAMHRIAQES